MVECSGSHCELMLSAIDKRMERIENNQTVILSIIEGLKIESALNGLRNRIFYSGLFLVITPVINYIFIRVFKIIS